MISSVRTPEDPVVVPDVAHHGRAEAAGGVHAGTGDVDAGSTRERVEIERDERDEEEMREREEGRGRDRRT